MKPRIASLLPSATEICFALGLGDQVVGVSHECDYPKEAAGRPLLTRSTVDSKARSAEIDRQVREQMTQGLSLYRVEEAELRRLRPDLIVTQDTCQVCAVTFDTVRETTARLLGQDAEIVSLSPVSLEDVYDDFRRVGGAAGAEDMAAEAAAALKTRIERVEARARELARPRVVGIEWLDPPMLVGHWTPEILRIAGGDPVGGHPGAPTRATTWEAIAALEPDVVLVAPCGFEVDQTLSELPAIFENPTFQTLPAVLRGQLVVIDGNAFFNRPGPRLAESAELAALALHPEVFGDLVDLSTPAMGKAPLHRVAHSPIPH